MSRFRPVSGVIEIEGKTRNQPILLGRLPNAGPSSRRCVNER
jgi:hypothetical protein